MFNIFRKKTEKERLKLQHNHLMAEAHRLSHIYRRHSDPKLKEADRIRQVLDKIDQTA